MDKFPIKKNGSKIKRGLRGWGKSENSPLDLFLRGKSNLHREVDRLFEDFWHIGGASSLLSPWSETMPSPLVDETEDEKGFHIEVELPGMDQDDVEVSYSDGLLTISGEKKVEKEEKKKDYYRKERSFGAFRRDVTIPAEIEEEKIQASFKKGVLSISLPKTKEAQKKVKKISVQSS